MECDGDGCKQNVVQAADLDQTFPLVSEIGKLCKLRQPLHPCGAPAPKQATCHSVPCICIDIKVHFFKVLNHICLLLHLFAATYLNFVVALQLNWPPATATWPLGCVFVQSVKSYLSVITFICSNLFELATCHCELASRLCICFKVYSHLCTKVIIFVL